MNYEVTSIEKQDERFLLSADNQKISADYLCIATGGYPKMMQFNWLEQLGHTIETPVPSLFTFNIPSHNFAQLMGISVDNAVVKISGTKLQQQGAVLITHWGLSGPAVLKLSAWGARILNEKNYHFSITVNWLGDKNESQLRDEWIMFRQKLSSQLIQHGNPFQIPSRLWLYLLKESFIEKSTRWAEVTSKQQNQLIKNLTAFELQVKGKTTFKEEFVTCGGIALHEVDVNLMQSKKMKQLFFTGEVLDVDGITGGFNFQNAWTTAWIAANAIAKLSEI
jgi:predicted Rossmann fold flavoprotein